MTCNSKAKNKYKHFLRLLAIIMIISVTAVFSMPLTAWGAVLPEASGVINSDDGVCVRSDAGTSYDIVAVLDDRTEVEVLGDKKDIDGNVWYEIGISDITGYVRYDLIEVSGYYPDGSDDPEPSSAFQDEQETAENVTDADGQEEITDDTDLTDGEDPELNVPEDTEEPVTEDEDPAADDEALIEEETAETERASAGASVYPAEGTISSGDGAYVRSDAGTGYSSIALLGYGTAVTIYGEKKGTDGYTWYEVKVSGKTGYIRSDLVNVSIPEDTSSEIDVSSMTDEQFTAYLTEQGFPATYIQPLLSLHKKHPSWQFKAAMTGLNFGDVITKESKPGICVVASSLPVYYRSKEAGNYDSGTGTYISHDSGGWYTATPEVIRYYMDPRNFFDESGIFQFMTHSFDSSTQTKPQLATLVKGTFLSGAYPKVSGETSSFSTYVDAVYEAGRLSGVNPFVLASMIIVEQGADGGGASISGTEAGYEGLFNFFNVGAAAGGGRSAVANGLIYAGSSGSYDRPWNTRYKSILGGAKFYYAGYVGLKQNTLYFKKFNVQNGINAVATHQYMSNVQGALLEAYRLAKGYEGTETAITFVIPVYNNMPQVPCELPTDPSADPNAATGTVIPSDGVYVRSDAGTSYSIVMSLTGGTVVTVTGSKKGSDGYVWYAVSYGGKSGYVRSDLLAVKGTVPGDGSSGTTPETPEEQFEPRTGTVLPANGVNVRSDAGTSFSVVMVLMRGTQVTVTGILKGTDGYDWYRIEYNGKTGYIRSDSLSVKDNSSSSFDEINRIAGADRYETAFASADRLKTELGISAFQNIVIASGTNFPDALAGSYLAKVKNAPILLANRSKATDVANYVKNNMTSSGMVYILGGTGAVPKDVETALNNSGITNIKRISGADRYITNIEILKEAGVDGQDILVCSGTGYADSLSASAAGKPILLVGNSLLSSQKGYLQSIKGKASGNVYVIGGTGAVSDQVFSEVSAYASGEKVRISGDTRYATSAAVADKFLPGTHDSVVLAYALNYPDGLSGGRVANAMNAPLLLVAHNRCTSAKQYVSGHGSKKCIVIGGTALISEATLNTI